MLMASDVKVDMRKVNLTVIRPWVAKKIVELVGFEDEVVIEYAMGLLEDESQPVGDISSRVTSLD
jgi:serine/arginine repetitive matrix protein 1